MTDPLTPDLTHMTGRLARTAGEPEVFPHETEVAAMLADHVAAGDTGAVTRLVNGLEYELGPWRVNPWRLIEHIAALALAAATPAVPGGESRHAPPLAAGPEAVSTPAAS